MTRNEFDKLYLGKAVYCDTEEKANHFLALADSVGYKWISGRKLIEENGWEIYEKETCYLVTDDGFMFCNKDHFVLNGHQITEYQPQLKFKVGDRVRIKDTIFAAFNGRVGVIIATGSSNLMLHSVKVACDEWSLWFNVKQLEKVEEPTYKEETIDDIIKEVKVKLSEINVLLNRLEKKKKGE